MFSSREGSLFKLKFAQQVNILSKMDIQLVSYSRELIYNIMILENITKDDEILLPDYLCSTVIESILPFTDKIYFYNMDDKLSFNEKDIQKLVTKKTKIIFFVDYFGVEASLSSEFELFLENNNIVVVKDSAHSFLTLFNNQFQTKVKYDYLVSSIYKNLPVQVGAIGLGKFEKEYNFINFNIFVKRYMIMCLKNIFCLIGLKKYINRGITNIIVTNEKYKRYDKGINISSFYRYFLLRLDLTNRILECQDLAIKYYDIFRHCEHYDSLFTINTMKINVLQAYPILCTNKVYRDKLLEHLKKECIDTYTWPTFHKMNCKSILWDKVLLIPLSKKVLNLLQRIEYV